MTNINDTEYKTLKELKQDLIDNGMSPESVKAFIKREQAIEVLNILKEKKMIEKQVINPVKEEVKKVASIEEAPNPSEEKAIEKSWRSKAQIMMDIWLTEPKVRTLIPSDPGKKPGNVEWRTDKFGMKVQVATTPEDTIESFQANGAKWLIPKGVYVEVPERVAKGLAERLQLTNEAGSNISLDRIDPTTGKVMSDIL
jgi:predicted nucleic-acid-binding protein